MLAIDSFSGDNRYLSNFYQTEVPYKGLVFPSSEYAFAAAKTDDPEDHLIISQLPTSREAKSYGRNVDLIGNWEVVKFAEMSKIVDAKFRNSDSIRYRLIDTSNAILIEGNTWHDQIWGSCFCSKHKNLPGDNALGVILMHTRMTLKAEYYGYP